MSVFRVERCSVYDTSNTRETNFQQKGLPAKVTDHYVIHCQRKYTYYPVNRLVIHSNDSK